MSFGIVHHERGNEPGAKRIESVFLNERNITGTYISPGPPIEETNRRRTERAYRAAELVLGARLRNTSDRLLIEKWTYNVNEHPPPECLRNLYLIILALTIETNSSRRTDTLDGDYITSEFQQRNGKKFRVSNNLSYPLVYSQINR